MSPPQPLSTRGGWGTPLPNVWRGVCFLSEVFMTAPSTQIVYSGMWVRPSVLCGVVQFVSWDHTFVCTLYVQTGSTDP